MEPRGSLPHSQQPATCPYPKPHQSSPCLHPTSWRSILILFSHLRLGLSSGRLPSGLPTKILYARLFCRIRATWPAHLILLDFITRIIFRDEYRSLSFSLRTRRRTPNWNYTLYQVRVKLSTSSTQRIMWHLHILTCVCFKNVSCEQYWDLVC
jgi:hypothetical protein